MKFDPIAWFLYGALSTYLLWLIYLFAGVYGLLVVGLFICGGLIGSLVALMLNMVNENDKK